jgi:hypothetical protein
MKKMNSKEVLKKSREVEWKEIEKQVLLFDLKSSNFYRFNRTGSFVWKNINGKNSFNDLLLKLVQSFEVTKTQAKKDLTEFIKELKEKQLVALK